MRKPEEIQQEIDKLQIELKKSKLEHALTPLWIDDEHFKQKNNDIIGFFRLDKARVILTALNEGKLLLIKHESIGNYRVYMSINGNRILVKNSDGTELKTKVAKFENNSCTWIPDSLINEDTITNFIVHLPGDWYIINKEYLK